MSTYAIGDIQGCFSELQELLAKINFTQKKDLLWFVGDLVNRGPASLQVLRFVKNLPNKIVVLGNHDIHLLVLYYIQNHHCKQHTMSDILAAQDAAELLTWLRMQKLLHYDANLGYVMVHAGIYPWWNLAEAIAFAQEAENALHGENYLQLLAHIHGNKPLGWSDNLVGFARLRFIINAFVRMRVCDMQGRLDFTMDGNPNDAPANFMPWFKIPLQKTKGVKIIFGHWAALAGKTGKPGIYALDTGCVWGRYLTAMRLEDGKKFQVKSKFCYT